jgi:hypothetical protein
MLRYDRSQDKFGSGIQQDLFWANSIQANGHVLHGQASLTLQGYLVGKGLHGLDNVVTPVGFQYLNGIVGLSQGHGRQNTTAMFLDQGMQIMRFHGMQNCQQGLLANAALNFVIGT